MYTCVWSAVAITSPALFISDPIPSLWSEEGALGMAHKAPVAPKPGMQERAGQCGEKRKVEQTRLRGGIPGQSEGKEVRKSVRDHSEGALLVTRGAVGPKPSLHLSEVCLHCVLILPPPFPPSSFVPVSWTLLVSCTESVTRRRLIHRTRSLVLIQQEKLPASLSACGSAELASGPRDLLS